MPDLAVLYAVTLAAFLVIDLAWLGLVARGFYRAQLGPLMAERVRWGAALAFYALFVAGLVAFAVAPGVADGDAGAAALRGAAFGFFTYMTYDLTNLATLRGWPARLAVVDVAWGTALGALVALAGTAAGSALGLTAG